MNERRTRVWVGIDAGKGHHWAAVVDETGATLWSKKIDNDESAILTALGEILEPADEVQWAVDIAGTSSALLPALLAGHGHQVVYVPGRTVNRMSGAYRGEAKTDARDAYVIAETARHRRDFAIIDVPAQLAADLAVLTAHRTDLVADSLHIEGHLRYALLSAATDRATDFEELLSAAMTSVPFCSNLTITPAWGPLLAAALPSGYGQGTDLTLAQHRYLDALADRDVCWRHTQLITSWFDDIGLPTDRGAIRALLRGSAPGRNTARSE